MYTSPKIGVSIFSKTFWSYSCDVEMNKGFHLNVSFKAFISSSTVGDKILTDVLFLSCYRSHLVGILNLESMLVLLMTRIDDLYYC